jgi:DNA polymerase I-like protein with 3'-5' exonuclease and polymerase domains
MKTDSKEQPISVDAAQPTSVDSLSSTGRTISTTPALQNIPIRTEFCRKLRDIFQRDRS